MSGFSQKLFRNYGTRKVVGHTLNLRGKLNNCGIPGKTEEILRKPLINVNVFKRHCSSYTWSYRPLNRYFQGLGVKHYKKYNTSNHVESSRLNCLSRKQYNLILPILMGSATIGGSSKDPQADCSKITDLLDNMKTYLKNSVTLYADSDDGIPDINTLAKDISEHGVRKIEEAQKLLQQKLKKMQGDLKKTSDEFEKELLKLTINAIQEAIDVLEAIKKSIKKELRNGKKRK